MAGNHGGAVVAGVQPHPGRAGVCWYGEVHGKGCPLCIADRPHSDLASDADARFSTDVGF